MDGNKIFNADLIIALDHIYRPCKLIMSKYKQEIESQEYAACSFHIGNRHIKFRAAKITPTTTGQFVFPKSVLHEKSLVSKEGHGGKQAMRVYPPWDVTENKQAQKTQAWQLLYFFEI